jgi:hypothetical protein
LTYYFFTGGEGGWYICETTFLQSTRIPVLFEVKAQPNEVLPAEKQFSNEPAGHISR